MRVAHKGGKRRKPPKAGHEGGGGVEVGDDEDAGCNSCKSSSSSYSSDVSPEVWMCMLVRVGGGFSLASIQSRFSFHIRILFDNKMCECKGA